MSLRQQAMKNNASIAPSKPSPLRSSISAASMPPPEDDEDYPTVSTIPRGKAPSAASSSSSSRERSKTSQSMALSSSSSRERSIAPSSMPSPSMVRDPTRTPAQSQTPRSIALSASMITQGSMQSSSMVRDNSRAGRSVAPSASKTSQSMAPSSSSRERSIAPSSMPSPSMLRDHTRAPAQSQTPWSIAPAASKTSQSVMLSSSMVRDNSKVSRSIAPFANRATQIVMPSVRDHSNAARSIAPPSMSKSPMDFTEEEIEKIQSIRSTMSKRPGQSILQNEEDRMMASRQSRLESLTPRELQKQAIWVQNHLNINGSCFDKFPWERAEEYKGYMCKGGRHFVSDDLIAEGKGGWFALKELGILSKGWRGHYYGDPVYPSKAICAKDGREFQVPRKESDGPIPEAAE